MKLFQWTMKNSYSIAFIVDIPDHAVPSGVATAAFDRMSFLASANGNNAFFALLDEALKRADVGAIAVSLNSLCIFDEELLGRLELACAGGAGGTAWAVLAATGLAPNKSTFSVVYPSASPRLFDMNAAAPIIDCGLDLFVLNAPFIRAHKDAVLDADLPLESVAQWSIVTGYIEGRVSAFRPELAIGIDGAERARDHHKHVSAMQAAFAHSLADDTLGSLSGTIPPGHPARIGMFGRSSTPPMPPWRR